MSENKGGKEASGMKGEEEGKKERSYLISLSSSFLPLFFGGFLCVCVRGEGGRMLWADGDTTHCFFDAKNEKRREMMMMVRRSWRERKEELREVFVYAQREREGCCIYILNEDEDEDVEDAAEESVWKRKRERKRKLVIMKDSKRMCKIKSSGNAWFFSVCYERMKTERVYEKDGECEGEYVT